MTSSFEPTYQDEKAPSYTPLPPSKESLLPSSSPTAHKRKRSLFGLNRAQLVALALLAVQLCFLAKGHLNSSSASDSEAELSLVDIQGGPGCVQPPKTPIKQSELGRSDLFKTPQFRAVQVERLLGAIRMNTETVSHHIYDE